MFVKLRNDFVLTAMSLLSVVLVVSFAAIYVSTATRLSLAPEGRPIPGRVLDGRFGDNEFRDYLEQQRRADADQTLRGLAITLLLTGAATLTAGYFVSRYLADRAIKPVEEAYARERQFVADASHELKTPLAVINANIEAELVGKRRPSKWLAAVQDETSRMNMLITNLLSLAQIDAVGPTGHITTFDVSKVVGRALVASEPFARDKSLKLSRHLQKALFIGSDQDKVSQIVMILLDNAVKYTEPGNEITVTTQLTNGRAQVIVSNAHESIAEDKLIKLFDRFYQADDSHRTKGHGLGLAIAQSASRSIDADLTVTQAEGRIIFTLSLPTQNSLSLHP